MESGTTARIATSRSEDPNVGPSGAGGYDPCSDEELVLRTRAGENAAFDALVARHRDRLYTLSLGSLADEETAGAALCDAVVAAYRNLAGWTPGCRPGAWLGLYVLREVFRRLDPPRGRYTVVTRPTA